MDLLFGAAYYLEYMPYDRLEKDIEMMKKAGMNVVRIAESTWSTLEPTEGVFDFSYIDRVLDATEKAGMSVIIGTPTYAIPAWLEKKDSDVNVTTQHGRADYGHRQLMNLWNPTFRERAEIMIRKLIAHTATKKHVIGFQIDNETKHYGNYGEEVQKLFRAYLQEKFVTTEKLNQAFYLAYWSNAIHSWEDFPDMKGCVNAGLVSEYETFRRRLAAEYLAWQSDMIREYKTEEQFITHNFDFEWKKFGADIAQDGYSYGVQPDINHYEASKCLTIAGTDIYHPTQDELTGAEIAYGGDSIRSLKQAPYVVLECQAQAFKYWTPYPGQLRLHAYSHLASGATGLLYWNWHSIHNGYETYWKGLLSHDLRENEPYLEAYRFGAEWKQHKEHLVLKKKNQVALVVDNKSLDASKWFPIDRDLSYNDVVRWMYDSLYEMNIECDIVDINALEPNDYRMLITPALYCVKEEMLFKLEKFVQDGGVLVSSFRSFVADEYLSVYPDVQPHVLHNCFGMSYQQHTEPSNLNILGEPVTYFAELLKTKEAESLADYEHRYWSKYAGITKNTFGTGAAYYIGCYTEKDVLKEVYRKAIEDAHVANASYNQNEKWPIIIRSGTNELDKEVHYVMNYSMNEQEYICPFDCVEDVLSGDVYRQGEKISLSDWDVKVLEVR